MLKLIRVYSHYYFSIHFSYLLFYFYVLMKSIYFVVHCILIQFNYLIILYKFDLTRNNLRVLKERYMITKTNTRTSYILSLHFPNISLVSHCSLISLLKRKRYALKEKDGRNLAQKKNKQKFEK